MTHAAEDFWFLHFGHRAMSDLYQNTKTLTHYAFDASIEPFQEGKIIQ